MPKIGQDRVGIVRVGPVVASQPRAKPRLSCLSLFRTRTSTRRGSCWTGTAGSTRTLRQPRDEETGRWSAAMMPEKRSVFGSGSYSRGLLGIRPESLDGPRIWRSRHRGEVDTRLVSRNTGISIGCQPSVSASLAAGSRQGLSGHSLRGEARGGSRASWSMRRGPLETLRRRPSATRTSATREKQREESVPSMKRRDSPNDVTVLFCFNPKTRLGAHSSQRLIGKKGRLCH